MPDCAANLWKRLLSKEDIEHGREVKNHISKIPDWCVPKQKATVEALGLRKLHKTVEMPDNGAVRGMIQSVRNLVKVEEV